MTGLKQPISTSQRSNLLVAFVFRVAKALILQGEGIVHVDNILNYYLVTLSANKLIHIQTLGYATKSKMAILLFIVSM